MGIIKSILLSEYECKIVWTHIHRYQSQSSTTAKSSTSTKYLKNFTIIWSSSVIKNSKDRDSNKFIIKYLGGNGAEHAWWAYYNTLIV